MIKAGKYSIVMKFGIITPVFEGCFDSLALLSRELFLQTYGNWDWVLCSNGPSERMEEFAAQKRKELYQRPEKSPYLAGAFPGTPTIRACHIPRELDHTFPHLIDNLAKRRNFCIHASDADYIFMIDADAKIVDNRMFEKVRDVLGTTQKDICVWKIRHETEGILPIFPPAYRRLDMLNFCVSSRVAKEIGYYNHHKLRKTSNDFWYFMDAFNEVAGDFAFIDEIFAEHNGNRTYTTANDKFASSDPFEQITRSVPFSWISRQIKGVVWRGSRDK